MLDRLRIGGVRAGVRVAQAVPTRFGYSVAGFAGSVMSVTARGMRRQYDENVASALGARPPDLARLRRRAFRNLAWNYFELATIPAMSCEQLLRSGSIVGLDRALAESVARGSTGAVIAFGHVGNIEVLGHLGAHIPGDRFAVVVERVADADMFDIVSRLRTCHGLEVIPADEPRRILTALRSGTHLIVACDFDSLGGGIVTSLFGRPARLPIGAARLALRCGAPLLMAEGWRDRADFPRHFTAHVLGPLDMERTGDRDVDVRTAVDGLARLLERHVIAHPDQWLAFRDVWAGGGDDPAQRRQVERKG